MTPLFFSWIFTSTRFHPKAYQMEFEVLGQAGVMTGLACRFAY
jgi:hypothetical protein